MFGIKLNGQFLDLYSNTVFSCVFNSPLYLGDDVDVIPLSLMFTTPLPLSASNQKQLSFPSLLDNASRFIQGQQASIYAQGVELFSGTLEVVSAQEKEVSVRILINFASKLKDVKMRDLDLGTISTVYTRIYSLAKITLIEPENHDFIFAPVWNPAFWGDNDGKLDHANEDSDEFQNHFLQGGRSALQVYGHTITPFPKLTVVLKQIFKSIGLSLDNQFQTTLELKRLLLYSNASMCSKMGEFGILNFNPASGLSDTTQAEFLKHLCRKFSLGLFTNLLSNETQLVPFKAIIKRAAKYNWSQKCLSGYELTQNVEAPSVLSDKHKDTIIDADLEKLTQHTGPIADITDNESVYLSGQNAYYHKILVFPDPDNPSIPGVRQLTNARLKNYITTYNTKGSKYENGIGTLVLSRLKNPVEGFQMASIRMRGKYEPNETENYACEDRIFFYRGLQPSAIAGENYPMASSESRNLDALPIQGANHSLSWTGNDGIYERFWKENMSVLLSAKRVKMRIQLSLEDVLKFSFQDKVRIDNQEYLVKSMKITLSRHGLQPSEVELVSIL